LDIDTYANEMDKSDESDVELFTSDNSPFNFNPQGPGNGMEMKMDQVEEEEDIIETEYRNDINHKLIRIRRKLRRDSKRKDKTLLLRGSYKRKTPSLTRAHALNKRRKRTRSKLPKVMQEIINLANEKQMHRKSLARSYKRRKHRKLRRIYRKTIMQEIIDKEKNKMEDEDEDEDVYEDEEFMIFDPP